jgi:hypothetical protein
MLVNARLAYISIDGFLYSSCGQVSFSIASLFDRPRVTLSNRDRTRPNETFIITIIVQLDSNTNFETKSVNTRSKTFDFKTKWSRSKFSRCQKIEEGFVKFSLQYKQ